MSSKKTQIITIVTSVIMFAVMLFTVKYTEFKQSQSPSDATSVTTTESISDVVESIPPESTVSVTQEQTTNEITTTETTENISVTTASTQQDPPQQTDEIQPTYIDGILIVNKTYALPQSYAPGWDAEASSQLWKMIGDAQTQGIVLSIKSGYRSYIDQKIIYNGYVANDGQANADRYSARPGHSEHQSGLAFDLNSFASDFGETPEGIWIAQNCHKYGFIVRYPKEKEHITGYMYEPWHVRYLGVEKATAVFESGLCLEEYLGITSEYAE